MGDAPQDSMMPWQTPATVPAPSAVAPASALPFAATMSGHAFISARCPHRWTRAESQRSCPVNLVMHSTAAAATLGFNDCLSSPQRMLAKPPHPPSMVGSPGPGQSPTLVATESSHVAAGGGGGAGGGVL